jgi:AraC-like DNA-binding protein
MGSTAHKATKSIPVHRVAIVRSFTQFLEDVGAPVESGFRQSGLPWCALEDVNNYVPSHRFWKFLISMARSEGIPDLGFRVGDQFGANSADTHMVKLLRSSPTLYQGLIRASELCNKTVTNCRVGILQPPDSEYTYFYHRPSCNANNPAIEQISWFGLTTLLDMVRAYTGPQWQPAEIGLMADNGPCRYICEHFPHTRMRLSQAYSWIALDNTVLSMPPFNKQTAIQASTSPDYEALPGDFVGSLKLVLLTYIQERKLSLEFAARLCSTSKRTLQRNLREAGTNYQEVLSNTRFCVASHMLQNPAIKVTDIARRLGYSDSAHFARAFRRIAGVTPKVYRRQFSH